MDNFSNGKYERARERVNQLRKFYGSLASYVFFIVFFAALNYYLDHWSSKWFLWVAFFWGIGLLFKAIKVFGIIRLFGKDWEERKIKEFMENDNSQ